MLSAGIVIWLIVQIDGYLKKRAVFGLQQETKYLIWNRQDRYQFTVTAKLK